MPSASPSPGKRPSMTERNSSNTSLSSSSKQPAIAPKIHRPHVVGRHQRNLSHGKNLSKLGKVNSSANVANVKSHQRKRSGASGEIPAQSPRSPGLPKRNSSHVNLVKNTSHTNLRKNHSATVLGRNTSHNALKKLGLPPTTKAKPEKQKTGFFELGDQSSGEEEEAQWEDSTTQSPELTRNNSRVSIPARAETPNGDRLPVKPPAHSRLHQENTSSPPPLALKANDRSLPNLVQDSHLSPPLSQEPPLLHQNGRSSRAPPAMSTVSAVADSNGLKRSESSKSFTHIDHSDAASCSATPRTNVAEGSSSADRPVSRFLDATPGSTQRRMLGDVSDDESDTLMSNYKPQPSESPEKQRALNKSRFASTPSRTQQKLELQRREGMRPGGALTTPPSSSIGPSIGSSLSLHSRSGSRGRNRSLAEEMKAQKVDYETGIKQFTVVRRFHNPIVESMNRMRASGTLAADIGVVPHGPPKGRPQSRRGINVTPANGPAKAAVSRSLEDKRPSPLASRSNNGKVHWQRQESHDDIGVTPSQDGPDGADEEDGMSPEEALMRRIWNSREVYDPGEATVGR